MKTLLTTITTLFAVASFSSQAADFKFVPADTTVESKICAVAAENGYKAALKEGGYQARSLLCNGTTIRSFANKYAK